MTTAASGSMLQMATIARDMSSKAKTKAENSSAVTHPLPDPPPPPPVVRFNPQPPFGPSLEETRRRRFFFSLLVSVGLHATVIGATLVNWSFHRTDDAPPPAAMVVELAVMPASPPVTPTEIPPGPQQVQAAPKPTPLDKMKFDPPPQVDASLKPDFALPLKERATPMETEVIAKDARETTAPPSVQAPKEDKNEAPVEGNNAAPPSDAEQAWEGRILAKLERNKRYPAAAQAAGQQDTVFVRLVIDRQGRLVDASLKKSAGFSMLDSETLSLARRASPFPAPPSSVVGERIVRIVPVEFYIKKRP